MNLRHFVGKWVIVQFRNQDTWITSHVDDGRAAIVAMVNPNTRQPQMIPVPFVMGELIATEAGLALRIQDENNKKLDVHPNWDAVLCVTLACEAERVIVPS